MISGLNRLKWKLDSSESRPMRFSLFGLALLALGVNLTFTQTTKAAAWLSTGLLTNARDGFAATVLSNGKVLVTGGLNSTGQIASAELYDPTGSGTWSTTPSMFTGRYLHTSTLLNNGKALVAGGLAPGGGFLTDAELYDPTSSSWTFAAVLNLGRSRHTATLLPNGEVLVAGGLTDNTGNGVPSAEIYNPTNNSWTPAAPMVSARWFHTATLLLNGKVLVAAGAVFTNSAALYLSSAELYDPNSNSWSSAGSLSTPRYEHKATLLPNGQVLVTGGANASGSLTSAELYDPIRNSWTNTGSMILARTDFTTTLLPNGKVLAAGGLSTSSVILTNSEVYNPAIGQWAATAGLTTSRYFDAAVLLTNGNVLAIAGVNATNYLTSAELYNSSNVTVSKISLSSPTTVSNGTFQLAFTNIPDISFTIYGATNVSQPLRNWTVLGGPTEVSPGHYQFSDPQASNYMKRFYAISPP